MKIRTDVTEFLNLYNGDKRIRLIGDPSNYVLRIPNPEIISRYDDVSLWTKSFKTAAEFDFSKIPVYRINGTGPQMDDNVRALRTRDAELESIIKQAHKEINGNEDWYMMASRSKAIDSLERVTSYSNETPGSKENAIAVLRENLIRNAYLLEPESEYLALEGGQYGEIYRFRQEYSHFEAFLPAKQKIIEIFLKHTTQVV